MGFSKTGVYPPDKSIYPMDVFDRNLLDKYNDNREFEREVVTPRMATPEKPNPHAEGNNNVFVTSATNEVVPETPSPATARSEAVRHSTPSDPVVTSSAPTVQASTSGASIDKCSRPAVCNLSRSFDNILSSTMTTPSGSETALTKGSVTALNTSVPGTSNNTQTEPVTCNLSRSFESLLANQIMSPPSCQSGSAPRKRSSVKMH